MKYAFINSVILDGTENMEPKAGLAVITDGERIIDIVPNDSDFSGCEMIDLKGKYLMPGLINMHVHLPSNGKPSKKQTDAKKLVKFALMNKLTRRLLQAICESSAKTELYSGVTTLRTVGGVENYDTIIRDRINNGEIIGPRILASNYALSVNGGHMVGSVALGAQSVEETKELVRKIAKDKPDLIKLMITGGVLDLDENGEPGQLKMGEEYVKAACEEAHKLGLKVAAHVESPHGVLVALQNGVDSIEHGAEPTDEIIEEFKKHGAFHITTISPALPFAFFDRSVSNVSEAAQKCGKIVFDGIVSCAKACLKAGVPVGLGTDTGCPFITHYDMWRELVYFQEYCGVESAFALHCATLGNAKLLGLDNEIGSIAKGKCADFIVSDNNPLEGFEALRQLYMVVARGNIIREPKIKKYPNVEAELDKVLPRNK